MAGVRAWRWIQVVFWLLVLIWACYGLTVTIGEMFRFYG